MPLDFLLPKYFVTFVPRYILIRPKKKKQFGRKDPFAIYTYLVHSRQLSFVCVKNVPDILLTK